METTKKLPIWFWIVSIIALLWNLMGVTAYIGDAYMSEEMLALLPEGDQNYYTNRPAWVTASYAISVFAGALGCIALLLRKKWASILFALSLLALFAQSAYNFFMQDYIAIEGSRLLLPIVVLVFAVFLVWFSRYSTTKEWIK